MVGESTDIEDVLTFDCLRCAVRMNINAHQLCIGIAPPELSPLGHDGCPNSAFRVYPRLVVRDDHHQVCGCTAGIPVGQGCAAVRSTSANGSRTIAGTSESQFIKVDIN